MYPMPFILANFAAGTANLMLRFLQSRGIARRTQNIKGAASNRWAGFSGK